MDCMLRWWWVLPLVLAALPVLTLAFFALGILYLPKPFMVSAAWCLARLFYRVQIHHQERVPATGGVLLIGNHISWLDGFLMMMCSPRRPRMVIYAGNFEHPLMQKAAARWGGILIAGGPKSIVRALKEAREAIQRGEVVGMFPEGGISRTGVMNTFKAGVLKIIENTDAHVVPVYFDGLWGSIFSFSEHKFFWKIPRRWRYPIDVHFGQPLHSVRDVQSLRLAVQNLGAHAVSERLQRKTDLPQAVIRACKKRLFGLKVADSMGTEMTGGATLMRALILRRLLRRHVFQADEQYVGLLLPPSAGSVVTNLAVTFDRRVAVNLNYTVSSEVMNECIRQPGIRHVLTTRAVMEKLDLKIDAELVYLEDLRPKLTLVDKAIAAFSAYLLPASWISRLLGLQHNRPDDVMTIIFTSGSTGIPKGVMLTHANIRHNVDAVEQVIHMQPQDTIVGILPFFHSFGYTVTLWTVLALNIRGIYHFNPLDARQVAKIVEKYRATVLLTTPTFLRGFLRRCSPEEFKSLNTVVAGAEKLPVDLCDSFEKKFGIRPVEGYGTTELSPLVSVNVPPSRSVPGHAVDLREGTVGRPVPGVSARIIDLDDGHTLGTNQSGMLLISGPNVMKGYLNQPEKTAEVVRDGWYVTGDVALIDDDGFIRITGRESRFSKIGGEMVPHRKIEESLQQLVGGDEESAVQLAVTAVPDERKGERLIVLHTALPKSPQELCADLMALGLPNIYIPSPDSFFEVEQIPILGTGKLDLRRMKDLAIELAAKAS